MKKRSVFAFIFFLVFIFGLFTFWQYNLNLKLLRTPLSCGGDWSYNVRCPLGSYCRSIKREPLAGGLCQSFISPLSDLFIKITPKDTKPADEEKQKIDEEGQHLEEKGDLELKSRSSEYIYFPDLESSFSPTPLNMVKVYLYPPAKPLDKSKEGNLITRFYSQISGKNEVSEWKFVQEKGEFQETKHYQESI